ncbi:MAG: type II secretion system F family protein, partial [Planctomycetaceae bacterium]
TSFTSLLVQSDVTGTALSRALTEYSDSIRATLKERADTRANSASFQLLFPVSLLLMPAVFLFLLGPAIVQVSDFYGSQSNPVDQSRQQSLQSLNRQNTNAGNAAANR